MTERSLVVHFGSVDAMVSALQTAHDRLQSLVATTLSSVDAQIAGWAADTASRTAQTSYQQKLRTDHDALLRALTEVHKALTELREHAHDTEVDNVAVIG